MDMYVEQYCPHILLVRRVAQYCRTCLLKLDTSLPTYGTHTHPHMAWVLAHTVSNPCKALQQYSYSTLESCEPLRIRGQRTPHQPRGSQGSPYITPLLGSDFFTTPHIQIKTGYLHYVRVTPFYFPYSVRGWPQPLVFSRSLSHIDQLPRIEWSQSLNRSLLDCLQIFSFFVL